jgi:hypothetical protein
MNLQIWLLTIPDFVDIENWNPQAAYESCQYTFCLLWEQIVKTRMIRIFES